MFPYERKHHKKYYYPKEMKNKYPDYDDYPKSSHSPQPEVKYIPKPVIKDYIGQVINTYIPGYGRVNVYVKGISRHGMVELIIINPKPKDYISVHYSDMVGIYPPSI